MQDTQFRQAQKAWFISWKREVDDYNHLPLIMCIHLIITIFIY